MQFDNKVCIVTGGNAGIGRCIAESFSNEGARVYVIDKDIDHETDENIFCYKGDISEKEVLEDFAAWVLSKEEKIDFLINNACLMNGGILSGCSYEDFMYVQKVGVAAPYWLTVGIAALTHALAVSLSGMARVNSIAPGWIETARFHKDTEVPNYSEADIMQHPSQRIGEPEDIARAIMFLCDDKNSFINGTNLTIDGGMGRLMVYHNDNGWKMEL